LFSKPLEELSEDEIQGLIYLDAPFDVILRRNQSRQESIPEQVIYKLLGKLEVPDVTEAEVVEWVSTDSATSPNGGTIK
jgi:tRNA uridine 5-carbamoylmethylation protein Kti12